MYDPLTFIKYPTSPYIVHSSGLEIIVFPSSLFDEIKRLPESVASAKDFFYQAIYGNWTHVGEESSAMFKTIGVDLARSVPVMVHAKQRDCKRAFDKMIGYCSDWKEVVLFPTVMKVIATTNAFSLVGQQLATNDKWIKAVENYPMAAMIAVFAMSACPRLLRPLVAPLFFLPAVKIQWDIRRMLAPVIRADMEEYLRASNQKEFLRPEKGKVPFTAWLMARHKPGEGTREQLTIDHLLTSFESTPSTAASLYNIVADLAAHPEYVDILRDELATVMKDGKLPLTNLTELKKMDSVMRETFRQTPFALCKRSRVLPPALEPRINTLTQHTVSLYRVLRKPITLSIGPPLPAGSIICVDSHHINNSPDLWPNPEKWDGLRFYKLRQLPGNENRHQFVSTGADAPNWGDGAQACPGRFFANSTIKIALAHILLNYEFKLRDGEGRPKKVSMPNGSWAPDIKAKVLFRSRC